MIIIPAGTYLIGSMQGRYDESPEHLVEIKTFEMDEFPVTVSQVYEILSKADCTLPEAWRDVPPEKSDLPATGLSFFEAEQVAELSGKRIPTEEEYEVAAGRAFGRDSLTHRRPGAGPLPLMTAEEARKSGLVTPEGLIGMVGIIWHWTCSQYAWYECRDYCMRALSTSRYMTVRGGIWSSYDARISFRSFRDPTKGYSRVGFRCARNIKTIAR